DIVVNRNNTYVNNYNRNSRVNGGNRYGANGNWQHNPAHRGGAPFGNRATANRYGGTTRGQTVCQRQNAAPLNPRQRCAEQQGARNQFSSGARNNASSGLNRGAGGGGGDRVGNRQVSSGSMGSRDSSAFSGASSRSAAQASSARGSSSMGSRGGGGFSGGGGRGGGGRGGGRRRQWKPNMKRETMNSQLSNINLRALLLPLLVVAFSCATAVAQVKAPPMRSSSAAPAKQKTFTTPELAAQALIKAAESNDVPALLQLFGPEGKDLV